MPVKDAQALDTRSEPGRLILRVAPSDASVYLDGKFLGTASELSRLHAGLLVDSGKHLLEVVRPGFEALEREFSVDPGEEQELSVDLGEG